MGIIDLAGNPLVKKEKSKKKEPSPLSMRTGDMLAQMEGASPIAAGSMMRALGDVERQRGQNERGLAVLHRKREMEIVDGQDTEEVMNFDDWVRATHPELWAKRGGKVTRREYKLANEGYTTYLTFQKAKQQQSLSQAKIGTERAHALSYGRSNQPGNVAEGLMWYIRQNKPIPPVLMQAWNAKHSQLPGLKSKEGIAGRKLGAEVKWRGADRTAAMDRTEALVAGRKDIAVSSRAGAMDRSVSDRAGRMDIAELKAGAQGAAKSIAKDADILELGKAASNIGKNETFESWMASYMRIAPMTSPAQRATLRKALGRRLPSVKELEAMVVVPKGTPSQPAKTRSLLGVDRLWPDRKATAAAPPSLESVEQGWNQLDMALEGLRLHGIPEDRITRLRAVMEEKFIGVNGG